MSPSSRSFIPGHCILLDSALYALCLLLQVDGVYLLLLLWTRRDDVRDGRPLDLLTRPLLSNGMLFR